MRRARAPDAPTSERYEVQDGSTDRAWLQRFAWSDQLRKLNVQYFGNRSFR